jgi:hypothetical protein
MTGGGGDQMFLKFYGRAAGIKLILGLKGSGLPFMFHCRRLKLVS